MRNPVVADFFDPRGLFGVFCVTVFALSGCSSDDSSTAADTDAGTKVDSSSSSDASVPDTQSNVDTGAPNADATASADTSLPDTGTPPSGPSSCAYSLSGGHTSPTTNAPSACANGKIEQPSGAGDYTASIGGGFQSAASEIVTLACTLPSTAPPAAGSVWTLTSSSSSQGNCQLTIIAGTTASTWIASGSGTGAATLTFKAATLTHGSAHPTDVYYTYDVVLDGTLKAQTAGATDVTIHGTFTQTALPTGN